MSVVSGQCSRGQLLLLPGQLLLPGGGVRPVRRFERGLVFRAGHEALLVPLHVPHVLKPPDSAHLWTFGLHACRAGTQGCRLRRSALRLDCIAPSAPLHNACLLTHRLRISQPVHIRPRRELVRRPLSRATAALVAEGSAVVLLLLCGGRCRLPQRVADVNSRALCTRRPRGKDAHPLVQLLGHHARRRRRRGRPAAGRQRRHHDASGVTADKV